MSARTTPVGAPAPATVDPATVGPATVDPAIAAFAAAAAGLRIGGLQPLSTCDWPGRLVATVFCQGCPWTCRYCHNPDLLPVSSAATVRWQQVVDLLSRRAGRLDGVVFSGGEPTGQPVLAEAAREVRGLGFAVGLHTSGAYPRRLAGLMPLVDWVGLDIKAPPRRYRAVTGSPVAADRAWESLQLVVASGAACEVRTTVDSRLLDEAALLELVDLLAAEGVRTFALQQAEPTPVPARVLDHCRLSFPTFTHRPGLAA